MSHLVDADAETALVAVAKLAGELTGEASLGVEAKSLTVAALLSRLLSGNLLGLASEKDAEAAFLVVSHAAAGLPPDLSLTAVSSLLGRVAAADAVSPALRLRILFAAFNVVPHPRCRFAVLLQALSLATSSPDTPAADLSALLLRHVDAWAADWALDKPELRQLRLAVYQLVDKAGSDRAAAFRALLAYLALFEARLTLSAHTLKTPLFLTPHPQPHRERRPPCWPAWRRTQPPPPAPSSPPPTCTSATCWTWRR